MAAQTGFLYCLVIVLLVRRGGPRLSGVVVAAAGQDGMGVWRREDWTGQDTAGRRGTRTKYLLRADQAPCAATHAKRKGPSFHTAVTEGSAGQWLFRSPGMAGL